ncbi:tetratricopeptide repeat protein [Saccharothrix sp. HUAS TT1]|uniref:tetratricopeptide repeat protein n=1 Tax=unclassified Saccharothrix TaxID=2593673 RepID=UPI00345C4B41
MDGTQRAEAAFGGVAEQALRDINHTTNHYYAERRPPIASGTSVAPPLGRLNHRVRGRSELVAEVTDDLGGSIAVLAAGGGFGKTTVALEAVRNLPKVWWVDASSRDSLVAGLAEVALQAGADSHEVGEAWAGRAGSAIELLWRNLDRQAEPWVLVFDNADEPDVLAASGRRVGDGNGWLRLPRSTGSVLVTSRAGAGWPPAARVHHVRQLDPEDGAQVLLDLADAGSPEDAAALARRLGGLPLALRLAGRYLAVAKDALALPGLEPPTTFKAYQERWDERFTELTEGESASPRESLSRTWEMSMDLLAERGQPQTRQLLRLVSTFAEAPVPAFVLDATVMATSDLLRDVTAVQLSVLLKALQEVGLLDVLGSSVVVHPVVRDANRHQPDYEQNRQAYRALVARLLRAATKDLDHSDPATWPRWRSVLPHLADLGPHDDSDLDLETATLLYYGAGFTGEIGSHQVAEALYRRAIDLSTGAVGADHRETFAARHALGHLLQGKGDLAGAEAEHRTLVADQTRVLGADDSDTLDSRKCLAGVLREQGRWDEAEAEFRGVLAGRTRAQGETDISTLRIRHDLADLVEARGGLAESESEHRDVVAAMTRQLGPEHVQVTNVRTCLADTLKELGRLDDAEAEVRDVLAVIASRSTGDRTPPLGARRLLAEVMRLRGRLAEAVAESRAAVMDSSRIFGLEHPITLSIRHELGHLLEYQDDLEAAEEEHRRVIEAQERVLGPTHPNTLNTRSCLAQIHSKQRRFEEAEAGYLALLPVYERLLGAEHAVLLAIRHRLAHARAGRGDVEAAERDHREVIAAEERVLGPLHPDTLVSRHCLAGLLYDQGRHDEAEAEYRTTIALRTQVLGAEHHRTLATRYNLAGVLADLDRRDEAEAEYRAVLEVEARTLGADHPNTVKTREKLAELG